MPEHNKIDFWPVFYLVTPCLNADETIDKTILSVVSQSGNFAIRYHIQDGGSTDYTVRKLKEWKSKLNQNNSSINCSNVVFSYCSHKDGGVYEAINTGFRGMSIPDNAFMTWVNADDILAPNSLSSIIGISKQLQNTSWIGGTVNAVFENGEIMYHGSVAIPTEFIREGVCDGINWHTLQQEGTFWKNWLWEKAGGLNSDYRLAGDWDLWRRFSKHTEYIQVPWALGYFYERKGQISTIDNGRAYQEEIDKVLSYSERKAALRRLCSKEQKKIFSPMVYLDFASRRYNIIYSTIKGRIPWQARELFEVIDGREKEEIFACNTIFDPVNYRKSIIDNAFFRKIFNFSPRFFQRKLSFIKHRVILPIMKFPRELKIYFTLKRSGLFYYSYYYENYPDVKECKRNPLLHYIRHGGKEGRAPNPLFDTSWYVHTYPDVSRHGINPLLHYIKFGQFEGRNPGPYFSTKKYLDAYPDVRRTGINPLFHYLRYGVSEGREKFKDVRSQ
jgi:glycosyltransferase involved in cell wall biosynthesis